MKARILILVMMLMAVTSLSAQSTDLSTLTKKANNGDIESIVALTLYYFNAKDYTNTVKWLNVSNKYQLSGNNLGLISLIKGHCYAQGYGVTHDYNKALENYTIAAQFNNVGAMYNLGVMYNNGIGTKEDKKEAVKWFAKAAESGHTPAMYNLALMYKNGEGGVKKDYAKAIEWYTKAAENGYTDAMINLGLMYYNGEGTKKDLTKTSFWWKLGAQKGNETAKKYLKQLNDTGFDNDVASNSNSSSQENNLQTRQNNDTMEPSVIDNSIDKNVPTVSTIRDNTFAVIIGNENYDFVKVQYADNDAETFAVYCQKTLGLPKKNIRFYKDATYGKILAALKDIENIAKAYKGNLNVIFYYAGHGVPSETNHNAYLLPVDADGTQLEVCLSTKKLYQTLNNLHAKKVVVLMDACFSGAQRGDGMLASARGVAIMAENDVPTGNMVVFTAANGQQTAYPYKEKGHGMFTYFLLKKLHDTKGNVTLGDLTDYVSEQVAQQSVVVNKRSQTPTVIPATTLSGSWRNLKLQ